MRLVYFTDEKERRNYVKSFNFQTWELEFTADETQAQRCTDVRADFYSRLLNENKQAGIHVMVTA